MHPLAVLEQGEKGIITKIDADDHTVSRLNSTGFSLQTQVKIIQNFQKGPVIVFVRGTEIALGRKEVEHIFVTQNGKEN